MQIIQLTQITHYLSSLEQDVKESEIGPIWVNASKIDFFGNGYICIGQERITVKETPEEIAEKIKAASSEKLTTAYKKKLKIIQALALIARERVSDAITGMRDTNSALDEADLLLLATSCVKNYK